MKESPSTLDVKSAAHEAGDAGAGRALALLIAWSADEPGRAGEVALFEMEGSARVLGRGEAPRGQRSGRVVFSRQRPDRTEPAPPLASPAVSREQLRVTARRGALDVERIGRCVLHHRGAKVDRVTIAPGDTLVLKGQLVLFCTTRPRVLAPLRQFPASALRDFGAPDALGILGESPAAWHLRDLLAFHAKAGAHALVLGPSGAGKELCARAIHQLSSRAGRPFVARNAATLPAGLVDAELFGNTRNYPNPGMAERPGLVGAADGGTLFLDEIGELPAALHANLLRLLDEGGEYHRLGESHARRADLRLLAATNRAPEALKHDLLARLPLRVTVPGLDARREDIPLLIRHLLGRALARSPELVGRFADPSGEVRVSGELVEHLLHRSYPTHVRELEGLLWRALAESRGDRVDLPESMRAEALEGAGAEAAPRAAGVERAEQQPPAGSEDPARDDLLAAVARHDNNLVKAAQALGLPSRYALYRLLRKHGIDVRGLR
ncbi:MAG: sigma 54-interacting transcriptional regulator [Minicystis sp.]